MIISLLQKLLVNTAKNWPEIALSSIEKGYKGDACHLSYFIIIAFRQLNCNPATKFYIAAHDHRKGMRTCKHGETSIFKTDCTCYWKVAAFYVESVNIL